MFSTLSRVLVVVVVSSILVSLAASQQVGSSGYPGSYTGSQPSGGQAGGNPWLNFLRMYQMYMRYQMMMNGNSDMDDMFEN